MQGKRSDNSGNYDKGSEYPQSQTSSDRVVGVAYNGRCGICEKLFPPHPIGRPPADMLEVNVAPALNIGSNHGLNRRKYICGDCSQRVLDLLGIDNFDWGNG